MLTGWKARTSTSRAYIRIYRYPHKDPRPTLPRSWIFPLLAQLLCSARPRSLARAGRQRRPGGARPREGWGKMRRPGEPHEPGRLWRPGAAPIGAAVGRQPRPGRPPWPGIPGPGWPAGPRLRRAAMRGPLAAPATSAMRHSRRTLIERDSARAPPRRFPGRQVNITCYVNPKGEQYAGERATCDNASIIAKGGSHAHGDPSRANWPPPMAEAGGRYAAGEGTPPCWAAAPLGRHTMARAGRGQAGRRVGSWARGCRPCCPVRRRRIPRRIAACR